MLELNEVYRNHEVLSQIPIKVYCETQPTYGVIVVDRTSANPGIQGVTPIPLGKNHISIAKPESGKDRPYRGVRRFIRECLTNVNFLGNGSSEKMIIFTLSLLIQGGLYKFVSLLLQEYLQKFDPYEKNFRAWRLSNRQDKSKLLRGRDLTDALKWSSDQNLTEAHI